MEDEIAQAQINTEIDRAQREMLLALIKSLCCDDEDGPGLSYWLIKG